MIFTMVSVVIYCFNCLISLIVSSPMTHNARETVKEMGRLQRSRRRCLQQLITVISFWCFRWKCLGYINSLG